MTDDRFWIFRCQEEDLKLLQASIDLEGITALVDEQAGGVVAYILTAHEDTVLGLLTPTHT